MSQLELKDFQTLYEDARREALDSIESQLKKNLRREEAEWFEFAQNPEVAKHTRERIIALRAKLDMLHLVRELE